MSFPEGLAYPLGGSDFSHFYVQIRHEASAAFDVTLRFHVTTDYRPLEFGVLTIAAALSPLAITIPPGANAMSIDSICRKSFMNVNTLSSSTPASLSHLFLFKDLYAQTGKITGSQLTGHTLRILIP